MAFQPKINNLKSKLQRDRWLMKKILISRTDAIGDLLLATPLIHEIKHKIKGCFVAVLVSDYAKAVLENNPEVDEVIVYKKGSTGELAAKLRGYGFDTAIILFPRFGVARLIKKAGIPERIGTAYRWYSFLFFNKRIKMHRKHSLIHEADYNLLQAEELIGKKKAGRIFLYLKKNEIAEGGKYLSKKGIRPPFVIVYPGGRGSAENLSAARYAEVIEKLAGMTSAKILVASGKGEQFKAREIFGSLKNRKNVVVMNELLSIRQLAAVIKHAKLFISGSTGPMHIAAALGIKTISFFPFSGIKPTRWRPLGNTAEIIMPAEASSMDSISADYVAQKAAALLKGKTK